MPATIIDSFIVTLGLDPGPYRKAQREVREDVKRTKDELRGAGKDMEASGKQAAQFFGSLKVEVMGLLAVLTGGQGITNFARQQVTASAATGRLAYNLGLATEELSAWQGVMRATGGVSADADNSLQSLVKAFQDIQLTGQSPLIPYLQLLGISLKDLKDPTETLLKLSDAFAGMDPQRAAALGAGMGLSPTMINALMKGRQGVEAMLQAQRELGVVTEKDSEAAQKLTGSLSGLGDAAAKVGRDLLTTLIPAMDWLTRLLTRAAEWAQDHAPVVQGALIGLGVAAAGLAVALAAPILPFLALAAAIAGVGAAIGYLIDDFQKFKANGPSTINWAPFLGPIEKAKEGIEAIRRGWENATAAAGRFWDRMNGRQPGAARGATGAAPARPREATAGLTAEQRAYTMIAAHESFSAGAYWDVNAFRAGFGSDTVTDPRTGAVSRVGRNTTVTREQAAADLRRRIAKEFMPTARRQAGAGWDGLTDQTKAALTSVAYNYGSLPPAIAAAARTGDAAAIAAAITRQGTLPGIQNPTRRNQEAAAVLAGGAGLAARAANDNRTTTSTQTVTVGNITINTQATDARGIAAGIGPALRERGMVAQANTGLR